MTSLCRNPRVLIVTPEVAYLPHGIDSAADYLSAKASGLADVSAAMIKALFEQGADVHVSVPDYRAIFNGCLPAPLRRSLSMFKKKVPEERLHLAEDATFFHFSKEGDGRFNMLKKADKKETIHAKGVCT